MLKSIEVSSDFSWLSQHWEQAVRDQQKITADILAAVQQVAGQFQTAATGTR